MVLKLYFAPKANRAHPNVRFWHKADIRQRDRNVRYWGGKADIGRN
jgi:hypothetical protein